MSSAATNATLILAAAAAAPTATATTATTEPASAAAVRAGRRAVLRSARIARVARLRLSIERAGCFAPGAAGQIVTCARRIPAAIAGHVGPAFAAAVVLLPVSAALALAIDLAVAASVDVAVAAFGDGRVADLPPAIRGQLPGLRAIAPAAIAVVDVDVGAVVDVHAAAAMAARVAPAAAHAESPEHADGEAEAPAIARRVRIPIGTDIRWIVIAGAVDHHAIGRDDRTVVTGRVADEYRARRAAVDAHVSHIVHRRIRRDAVDHCRHRDRHRPWARRRRGREPDAVLHHVIGLRIDADHGRLRVGRVGERRTLDRLPLRLTAVEGHRGRLDIALHARGLWDFVGDGRFARLRRTGHRDQEVARRV